MFRCLAITTGVILALTTAIGQEAAPKFPRFRGEEIDKSLKVGYAVLLADLNADGKKDIIVVSGMKAYPQEIEDVVRQHPGVDDVAAVGVADATSGETVALAVVRKDPSLSEEAVRLHCEQHLAPYKRPRRIVFRDSLPRTNIGKVLRRQVRDELTAH